MSVCLCLSTDFHYGKQLQWLGNPLQRAELHLRKAAVAAVTPLIICKQSAVIFSNKFVEWKFRSTDAILQEVQHTAILTCRYVLFSISFSVALCSSPMCGSARFTVSPSSCSIRRKTPWAAGCCGPKFTVIFLRITSLGFSLFATVHKFNDHRTILVTTTLPT